MKTMTKENIITMVCNDTIYSRACVSEVLESTLDCIIRSLANGNKVQFSGFGTFEPKQRAKRTGRNPITNEAVNIPPCVAPVFKAGSVMNKLVKKKI